MLEKHSWRLPRGPLLAHQASRIAKLYGFLAKRLLLTFHGSAGAINKDDEPKSTQVRSPTQRNVKCRVRKAGHEESPLELLNVLRDCIAQRFRISGKSSGIYKAIQSPEVFENSIP